MKKTRIGHLANIEQMSWNELSALETELSAGMLEQTFVYICMAIALVRGGHNCGWFDSLRECVIFQVTTS